MNWDLRHRRSSLVIRLLLAAWITVVVVVLCATRRWWGLVFVVPLVLDFVLAPPDLGGRLRLIARRQRSSGSSQAAGQDTVAPTIASREKQAPQIRRVMQTSQMPNVYRTSSGRPADCCLSIISAL
jgi:hypothetical protein